MEKYYNPKKLLLNRERAENVIISHVCSCCIALCMCVWGVYFRAASSLSSSNNLVNSTKTFVYLNGFRDGLLNSKFISSAPSPPLSNFNLFCSYVYQEGGKEGTKSRRMVSKSGRRRGGKVKSVVGWLKLKRQLVSTVSNSVHNAGGGRNFIVSNLGIIITVISAEMEGRQKEALSDRLHKWYRHFPHGSVDTSEDWELKFIKSETVCNLTNGACLQMFSGKRDTIELDR